MRSNFQVGLKLPSTSTEFVRAYGVLSLEDAGPDHFVPRNWESRIYRLERRGSRRIARLVQRSHTTPRSPTLAARRLTVPARGLRPGPYAVRLVFDEDRPANYPSEEFVFRRCSA